MDWTGLTVIFTEELTAKQGAIPVEVRVRTAVPVKEGGGVHVALRVFSLGVKMPPEEVDQVPPVADPPVVPESWTVPP